MMNVRIAAACAAVLGAAAAGACSSASTGAAPPPPPTPVSTATQTAASSSTAAASTTTPAPTTTATAPPPTSPPSRGCPAAGSGVPAGAVNKQIIDVDGDGRPDLGWISGAATFGITTASGATFSIPIDLAGGGPRSVLVASPDGGATITALASDGRTVELLTVRNCGLFPVTNPEGQHYEFDLGFRGTGTGVGCSQVAGTPANSLVGLNVHLDGTGKPVDVQRTQIVIEGTTAHNGATDTVAVAGNPSAAQSGHEISCGDLTMARDGVIERG